MFITQDRKLSIFIGSAILLLVSASILTNKQILLLMLILGVLILFILVNNPVNLIYAQVFYNFAVKFAIESLGVPSAANYLTDVLTILIIFAAIKKLIREKGNHNLKLPLAIVLIFFVTTIFGLIINNQSIFLYTWGIRNNFRFYGFFFGCAVLMKKKDIDFILKAIIYLAFINVIVCIYQYNILHYSGDNLGGIFGTNVGVNIYLNTFMCITTVISIVQFMYKKTSAVISLLTIVSSVYISAVGEIKVFYIELIVIILCFVLFSKPNKKTILVLICSAFGVYSGIQLFYSIFPNWQNFFSLEKIISTGQYYASPTDLGRFSATSRVTDMFLKGDLSSLLFGLGLGSAETSQISMFSSQFYSDYGDVLHYTWLSQAFLLIETGWVGLVCVFSFFISVAYSCIKIRIKKPMYMDYCLITQILAVISCLLLIYNSTLRTEAGYFIYFMISIPFVLYNNESVSGISKVGIGNDKN